MKRFEFFWLRPRLPGFGMWWPDFSGHEKASNSFSNLSCFTYTRCVRVISQEFDCLTITLDDKWMSLSITTDRCGSIETKSRGTFSRSMRACMHAWCCGVVVLCAKICTCGFFGCVVSLSQQLKWTKAGQQEGPSCSHSNYHKKQGRSPNYLLTTVISKDNAVTTMAKGAERHPKLQSTLIVQP